MKKFIFSATLILFLFIAITVNAQLTEKPLEKSSGNLAKIVGGDPVEDISKYPWMVTLNADYRFPDLYLGHNCGGTLIAPDWVLTATHCLPRVYTHFHAVLGTASLSAPPGKYERIPIRRVLRHKDYDKDYAPTTYYNDIALLQLSFPSSMTPISGLMEVDEYIPFETMFTAIGWGMLQYPGEYPEDLQEVNVPYVDNETCRISMEQAGLTITDDMLCAGAWEGGRDACYGDSGGPLIRQVQGKDLLAGIVSFGHECAVRAKPGVYVRVSRYIDWIKDTARSECTFDALEQQFPEYFARPSESTIVMTAESDDMRYRSYPLSSSFLGLRGSKIVYSGILSDYELTELGTLDEWADSTNCRIVQ